MSTYFSREYLKTDFTIVPNSMCNSSLSLEAQGLLTWIFSKPNDWDFSQAGTISALKKQGIKIGNEKMGRIVSELRNKGYLLSYPNPEGGWIYYISMTPKYLTDTSLSENPNAENPHTTKPPYGNPNAENPKLIKKRLNKEKINKEKLYKKDFLKPVDNAEPVLKNQNLSSPIADDGKISDSKNLEKFQSDNLKTPQPSPKPFITKGPNKGMTRSEFEEHFNDFWHFYPRKVGKEKAKKALKSAFQKAHVDDEIGEGLGKFSFSGDPQFIPHPATWLNQKRWLDEGP